MSDVNLQLRFNGPALKDHEMDVTLLAPSLLAFGEMCQEANRILNGEESKMKVLVNADVKANCVTIQLVLAQGSLWEAAKALLHSQEHLATAKDILAWLGVIEKPTGMAWSLVKYLLWKGDKKEVSSELKKVDGGNVITVRIEGDNNNVTISQPVYNLSKSPKVVESLKVVASPVATKNGIDEAVFIEGKKEHLKIDTAKARQLRNVHADSDAIEPQIFTAHIVIYSPILDPDSKKWKFKLNKRVESIDISETNIAAEALERGVISVGDRYKVKLEMIERQTPGGGYKSDYKVKAVLSFTPGKSTRQQKFPLS